MKPFRRIALPDIAGDRRLLNSFMGIGATFLLLAFLGRASFSAMGAVVGFSPAAGFAAAMVGLHWEGRRHLGPMFGSLAGLVAVGLGAPLLTAVAFGVGASIECMLATALFRRFANPVDRPETAFWWAHWAGAAVAGSTVGAIPFAFVAGVDAGLAPYELVASWLSGHVGGMLLVAPGIWAFVRWQRTGGSRHQAELRQVGVGFAVVLAASGVGALLGLLLGRPEPFVLPVLALGWLALSAGHRVTVMASSVVASAILLAAQWWADHLSVSTVSVTVLVVLGHAAASGLAIESSARWHARALLAGVVDIATEAVLIVDADGRVMVGNPSARTLFGDPLEGRSVTELLPGLAADWTETMPTSVTIEGRGQHDQRTSIEVTVGTVDAPGRPMMALVCRDMTEMKAAVAAARRSAEIIDATPDLVGWTDETGSLLFLNQAGRAMIGAAGDNLLDSLAAAGLLAPQALEAATEHGIWHGETELLLESGIRLPVAETVITHRSEDGGVRFHSIIARDISERYQLEATKDEFVANVTHELRSPLTGVMGYLELLRDGVFGDLEPNVAEILGDVEMSAKQMLELINDLLDLWRVGGTGGGDTSVVLVGEVVEAAIHTIGPVAAGKRVTISFDAEEVAAVGDRRQLERAFLNVVSNAVKFTPTGGSVQVSVRSMGDRAVIRICDTGVGIPDTELEAVFQRFYRASTAEVANIPGTGLGLPLVREVVRAHGGEASIESVVGEGTTVVIDLPAMVSAGRMATAR